MEETSKLNKSKSSTAVIKLLPHLSGVGGWWLSTHHGPNDLLASFGSHLPIHRRQ